MKALFIILGALMLIGGIYCMFAPIETYSTIAWLIGIAMIFEGVGSAITWNSRRLFGLADGWTLVGAIASIVLGALLLGSFAMQMAVDYFIAIIIAVWLVFGGIVRIIAAINIRRFRNATGDDTFRSSWIGLLILGILVVILGILCIFNPLAVMASVGFLLGLAIAFVGAGLIVRGVMS